MIVDEIIDEYVGNELQDDERKRVEQYFLRSTERQNKLRFATELLGRAAVEQSARAPAPVPVHPGILERARSFWVNQGLFTRFATAFAAIVIVAGLVFVSIPGSRPSATYASIKLGISSSERSIGSEANKVRLEPGTSGVRIELTLPEQIPQAKTYRVELLDEQEASRNLPIESQTGQSLVVTADDITRGSYIIHLHAVNPDGTEQRIRGDYRFTVE